MVARGHGDRDAEDGPGGLMGCDWGDMEGKGEPGLGTWVAGEPLDEMKCGRADTDLGIYDKLELGR